MAVVLLFTYCLIDSFFSFGERKTFLQDSIDWVQRNEISAPFLTNNHTLAYASQRVKFYDKTHRYLSRQTLLAASVDTLIVIELNEQMRETMRSFVDSGEGESVIAFPAESARIGIYRRL